MQISYKLPGLMPEPAPLPPEEGLPGPSFRNRIRRLPRPVAQTWRSLLRVESAPSGPGGIGPPPRPPRLGLRDYAAERLKFRAMLDRHCRFFDGMAAKMSKLNVPPTDELRRMHGMLSLLVEYRDMEDAVAARALVEARG